MVKMVKHRRAQIVLLTTLFGKNAKHSLGSSESNTRANAEFSERPKRCNIGLYKQKATLALKTYCLAVGIQ